jgi:hypothetical protein
MTAITALSVRAARRDKGSDTLSMLELAPTAFANSTT